MDIENIAKNQVTKYFIFPHVGQKIVGRFFNLKVRGSTYM